MTITIQDFFLYPALILVRFVASLFHISHIPYGWELVLTGIVALSLFIGVLRILAALIKRLFGFRGRG